MHKYRRPEWDMPTVPRGLKEALTTHSTESARNSQEPRIDSHGQEASTNPRKEKSYLNQKLKGELCTGRDLSGCDTPTLAVMEATPDLRLRWYLEPSGTCGMEQHHSDADTLG